MNDHFTPFPKIIFNKNPRTKLGKYIDRDVPKMRKRVAWWLFERENLRSAKLFHATSSSEAESISEALRRWKMVDGRWEPPISDLRSPIFPGPRIVVAPNGVDVPERIPGREILEGKVSETEGEEVGVVYVQDPSEEGN